MKQGTQMQTLSDRILAEANSKRDYAMNTQALKFTKEGLQFKANGEIVVVEPTKLCLSQIATHQGIPQKYFEKMQEDQSDLLYTNVNHWFEKEPSVRMLRTLQNGKNVGRAFLSQRYRPLDNYDMMEAILPRMISAGCEIISAELTDRRLYIQAATPKLEGEVKKGDVVRAGIVVSNSEVGSGSVRVEPMLYRLVCTNGMILPSAIRKNHVGRAGDGEWNAGESYELYSDDTRKLDDKAFWAKVCDVVDASFSDIEFNRSLQKMLNASGVDTGNPTDSVTVIANKFDLLEKEKESVLAHLARGGDLSLWGLANAVTRTAEDVESYDRAIELERIGGRVIELDAKTFRNK